MFCVNCGKDLKGYETTKFCPYCGGAIGIHGTNETHTSGGNIGINVSSYIPSQVKTDMDPKRLLLLALTAFSALGLFFPFIYFYASAFGYSGSSQSTYTVLQLYKQISEVETMFSDIGVDVNLGTISGILVLPIISFLVSAIAGILSLYNALFAKNNISADGCAAGTAISSAIGLIILWVGISTFNTDIVNALGDEAAWFGISASARLTPLAFVLFIANIITFAIAKTLPTDKSYSSGAHNSLNKVCSRCGEHFMYGEKCPSCGSKDIRNE